MKILNLLPLALAAVLSTATTFGANAPVSQNEPPSGGDKPIVLSIPAMPSLSANPTPAELEAVYRQAWRLIADKYFDYAVVYSRFGSWKHRYDGRLTTPAELDAALRCMVESLHDRWTRYAGPPAQIGEPNSERLYPLGMSLTKLPEGSFVIEYITYGSPAYNATLLEGDVILSIGGTSLKQLDAEAVNHLLLGHKGVTTNVVAVCDGKECNVPMEFAAAVSPRVETKVLPGNCAYVRFPDFESDKRPAELFAAVLKLCQDAPNPLQALVLDLRNDPGGKFGVATGIASMFLERGAVVTSTTRRLRTVEDHKYTVVPWAPYDAQDASQAQRDVVRFLQSAPLVVLVNRSTASAAEVLTGCLKDSGRAFAVIGTPTFGKAVGWEQFVLPNGGRLTITSLSYVTPSGFNLAGKGISPTHHVVQLRNKKADAQLATALVLLRRQQTRKGQR